MKIFAAAMVGFFVAVAMNALAQALTPPVPISSAVTVQCNTDGTISVKVVKK